MNKIITIIVTYNGIRWIKQCLSSIVNSTITSDIFIVDNGSTDGTIEFIQNNFRHAILYCSSENLGFGAANNIGLKFALKECYDFIYLLNQDAWIKPDTFETLIAASQRNPNFGIISPLQVNAIETMVDKNFYSSCSRELFSDSILDLPLREVYSTDFVMAAHWLLTRNCLQTVGLFSPTFFHYGEDNNYVNRTIYHGLKVGIAPKAIGIHDREERAISLEKEDYLFYISHLNRLSNPNKNNTLSSTIAYYISRIIGHGRVKCISYLIKTISNLKKISNNKAISKNLGAFN